MVKKVYIGKVEDGMGSSSGWMPRYLPWLLPGTLNVRLEEQVPEIIWEKEIETHYGKNCKISKCLINDEEAYLIKPPKVSDRPPRYLAEIGHEKKIRDLLKIKNGDVVYLTFDTK